MERPTLRDSQAFEALFRNDHTVMLLVEPRSLVIADANSAAARFYGWSADELRARRFPDLEEAAATDDPDGLASARMREGREVYGTFAHRRADGSVRHVHVSGGPIRVAGRDLGYVVVHDVTDLLEARERLALRDRALDAAATAVAVTDAHGRIMWCNPAFTRLTGFHVDEAMGRTHGELLRSGRQDRAFYQDLWETVSRGETWQGELINQRKDGSVYPEEMTITPVLDSEKQPTHFIAVKQDISDRVRQRTERRRWAAVLAHARAGIALSDAAGTRLALMNQAYADMHGARVEALVGRPIASMFRPEDRPRLDAALATAEREGHAVFDAQRLREDGSTFPASTDVTRVSPDEDLDARLIITVHDQTRLRRTESRLEDQRRRAELAARTANLGFWTIDLRDRSVALSDAWKSQKGFEPHELDDDLAAWEGLLHPSDATEARRTLEAYLAYPAGAYRNEYRMRRRDGTYRWILSQGSLERDANGTPVALHGIHLDVTEVRTLSQRVETLTYTDVLTALPNREGLTQQLRTLLAGARWRGTKTAIVFAGLDRFRSINDSLGHAAGDEVLRQVGHAFQQRLRPGDVLGRFAGDAFVLVTSDLDDPQEADARARQLQDALASPVTVDGHELGLSCSIGIALAPTDGHEPAPLLSRAEAALNAAKAVGPGAVRFFAPDLNEQALARLRLRTELASALDRDELAAAFQAQVSLRDGSMVAAEALARWTHPSFGVVSPAEFVPLAERSGSIMALGRAMRRRALAQLAAWDAAGVHCPRVAVNVSARELADPRLADTIAEELDEHGTAPSRFEIEVTESAVMTSEEEALGTLAHLRDLGVRVAIDDFGTGYASLSYLRRLPAHVLKIDASFVRGVGTSASPPDEALVRGIVDLAAAFGMEVVGEGVETEAEHAFLREVGCSVGQGYLYAEPAAGDELAAWARARGRGRPEGTP